MTSALFWETLLEHVYCLSFKISVTQKDKLEVVQFPLLGVSNNVTSLVLG